MWQNDFLMKNYMLFLWLLVGSMVYGQVVPSNRMPLITKITATWCNPCGTWGWSLNEEIMTNNPDALTICVHASSSSQLYDPCAATMYSVFAPTSSGVPSWYVDGVRKTAYSQSGGVYTTQTKNAVKAHVDSVMLYDATAGTGFSWSWNGNTISIQAKTQFFNTETGDIYLGVYFIEDDIVKYQNGIGNNAVHHPTLRTNVSAELGDPLLNGTISQGQQFNANYNFTVPADWQKHKLRLMAILWKKDANNNYSIINTSVSEYLSQTTTLNRSMAENYSIFPNPVPNKTFSISPCNQCSFQIYDLLGKSIPFKVSYQNQQATVVLPNDVAPGVYIIQMQKGNKTTSHKLIVE